MIFGPVLKRWLEDETETHPKTKMYTNYYIEQMITVDWTNLVQSECMFMVLKKKLVKKKPLKTILYKMEMW